MKTNISAKNKNIKIG